MFGRELAVHDGHHFRNFIRLLARQHQVFLRLVKELLHSVAETGGEHAAFHGLPRFTDFFLQQAHAQRRKHARRQARKHHARTLQFQQTFVEFLFLDIDTLHHVADDGSILAAQALQFQQLLNHTADMRRHQGLLGDRQIVDVANQLGADDVALSRDQLA